MSRDISNLGAAIGTSDYASAATRLLERRREMLEVQTTLEQKRQEFRVKLDRMKAEENRLSSKRDELQDSLSKFNKFIQENEVKRSRADKKAIEEAKSKEDKEVEKQRLGKDVETMEKEKWKMWDQLQKMQRYQKFLEDVVSVAKGEYNEIKDIISRHTTLSDTFREHNDRVAQLNSELDEQKRKNEKQQKDRERQLLDLQTHLAQQQARLEQMYNAASKLQTQAERRHKAQSSIALLSGQAGMSIENLFQRSVASKKTTGGAIHLNLAEEISTPQMLKFIGDHIADMQAVATEYARQQRAGLMPPTSLPDRSNSMWGSVGMSFSGPS